MSSVASGFGEFRHPLAEGLILLSGEDKVDRPPQVGLEPLLALSVLPRRVAAVRLTRPGESKVPGTCEEDVIHEHDGYRVMPKRSASFELPKFSFTKTARPKYLSTTC